MEHSEEITKQFKTLAELATIIPGFSARPQERRKTGHYLLLGGRNIQNGQLALTKADSYVNSIERDSFRRAIAKPGDIIVSTLFDRRKLYRYRKDDPPAIVNNSCAIIRAGNESDYIVSYLRTLGGAQDFIDKATRATGGTFIPRLSTEQLANIQIPILPVAELKRLSDASIERASGNELLDIKKELESRDSEIKQLRSQNEELVRFYEDRLRAVTEQLATNSLASRIKHGETTSLEFKSSLRFNMRANKFDREIENSVLKTIVAFCNSAGGELLIGVADDKSVVGIEHDGFSNDDKFQLHLSNLISERIVPPVGELVSYDMLTIDGKSVCHVKCKQSKNRGVWFIPDNRSPERFYIRLGPSSRELSPREASEYASEHFSKMARDES